MKLMEPGTLLDGFVVGECIHSGGMAHIYRVHYADGAPDPGFSMVMKVPRMTAGDGAENIVSFEVEHQIMQVMSGPHVPRFVAAGDLDRGGGLGQARGRAVGLGDPEALDHAEAEGAGDVGLPRQQVGLFLHQVGGGQELAVEVAWPGAAGVNEHAAVDFTLVN